MTAGTYCATVIVDQASNVKVLVVGNQNQENVHDRNVDEYS